MEKPTKEQLLQNDIVKEIAEEYANFAFIKPKNSFEEYKNSIIKKPEWEILSYKRRMPPCITWIPSPTYKVIGTPIEQYWNIYSVKRLSDNCIFSIGDRVKEGTIKRFRITPNNLWQFSCYIENNWISNDCLIKIKPLFISSDGVEIFEGDVVWTSERKKIEIYSLKAETLVPLSMNSVINQELYYPVFKSKDKLIEYLINNAKVLSIEDVGNEMSDNVLKDCPHKGEKHIHGSFTLKSLSQLVKERLNLK